MRIAEVWINDRKRKVGRCRWWWCLGLLSVTRLGCGKKHSLENERRCLWRILDLGPNLVSISLYTWFFFKKKVFTAKKEEKRGSTHFIPCFPSLSCNTYIIDLGACTPRMTWTILMCWQSNFCLKNQNKISHYIKIQNFIALLSYSSSNTNCLEFHRWLKSLSLSQTI